MPAPVTIVQSSGATADGYIFYTQQGGGPGANGPVIIDTSGRPVWYLPLATGVAADFRVQNYRGRPVLTWAQGLGFQNPTPNTGVDYIYDDSYRPIAEVRAGNGLNSDPHEFQLTAEDTALIAIYHTVPWDLSALGGSANGSLLECVVQEIDVASGAVLFEWHSSDHVPPDENQFAPIGIAVFDYFHLNSVKVDVDGNLILSARNTSTLYKVDRRSGEIIWRLGGKKSDFALAPGVSFALQHNATPVDARTIRLFDNEDSAPSHVLWLTIDDTTKTINARGWQHPARLFAATEGGTQDLPNGDTFVNWGSAGAYTEFDSAGNVVYDVRLARGVSSYRAVKMPWSGHPTTIPQVAAYRNEDGASVVHAIWNGATDAATWQVHGTTVDGADFLSAEQPWNGLDTTIVVATPLRAAQVIARDQVGLVIGTSAVTAGTFPAPAPTLTRQPGSLTVPAGSPLVLSVCASNGKKYQWRFNGTNLTDGPTATANIVGATTSRLSIDPAGVSNSGRYTCVVSNETASVISSPAKIVVSATVDSSHLSNISCRSGVGAGENALITGFVVAGGTADRPADIVVRASGPALRQFGVSDALPDPRLDLYNLDSGTGPIASRLSAGTAGGTQINVLSVAGLPGRDAFIEQPLAAANYTANVTSPGQLSGVAMIEVDDVSAEGPADEQVRIVNCSGRAFVGTGADVLVTGFVISGDSGRTVLIRAAGPALARYGVTGTLADPRLSVYASDGTLVASNDDWRGDSLIDAWAKNLGAFAWADPSSKDAAILITLPPGAYTAQVSGAANDTGVAIVEVYDTR